MSIGLKCPETGELKIVAGSAQSLSSADVEKLLADWIEERGYVKRDEVSQLASGAGFTSDRFIDLATASGGTYIAPAYGEIAIHASAGANRVWIGLHNLTNGQRIHMNDGNGDGAGILRVRPGDNIQLNWTGTILMRRFYYAEGAPSS